MLVNEHNAEDCARMDPSGPFAPDLKGREFYCTCPYGAHGFFIVAEGDSGEQVMGFLPREFQKGTKVLAVEVFHI